MNDMVTIASFEYVHQAYVLKSRLESEGISCTITNENMLQVYHFLSNAMGGAQLQVPAVDYDRAVEIMKDAGLEPDTGELNPLLKRLVLVTQGLPFGKSWLPLTKAFVVVAVLLTMIVSAFVSYVYLSGPDSTAAEAREIWRVNLEKSNAMHLYYASADDPNIEQYAFENPKRALAQVEHFRSSIELKVLPWERAIALYHLGSYPLALIEFNRYLSAQGSQVDPSVYYNMALCYRNQSSTDSALLFFQLAFEHLNKVIPNTQNENAAAIQINAGNVAYYRARLYCLIHAAELMEFKGNHGKAIEHYSLANHLAQDCIALGFNCQEPQTFIMSRLQYHQNELE